MSSYNLSHLKQLEHEAIYVMREVAAQFERPVLLFSGGKDSIVMVRLAQQAFYPAAIPFPLLHIDTGHNFPETIEYRDWLVKSVGARLHRPHRAGLDRQGPRAPRKRAPTRAATGCRPSRCSMRSRSSAPMRPSAARRRDEEKARAKERFFSHRDEFGQWDPKNQRPELWNIFNGRLHQGEHFRVFPLSNWTEMDVWQYIAAEKIEIPSLYFSHSARSSTARGMLLADTHFNTLLPGEKYETAHRPLPHRGRRHLHRRRRIDREQPRGDHRRSRRRPHHRARRPRRRQAQRDRHGRPQKGRLFLRTRRASF